jgi:ferredoxin
MARMAPPDLPPERHEPDARFEVRIEPAGLRFEAGRSLPLLKAAQEAGIRLPSSCRNGTCRACMCRLTSGRIEYSVEWPGLLAEEKREGWILPCVALARSALVIEAPAVAAPAA